MLAAWFVAVHPAQLVLRSGSVNHLGVTVQPVPSYIGTRAVPDLRFPNPT